MPPLRRKRSKKVANSSVIFTQATNEDLGRKQLCVYAECHQSGMIIGPVWGHMDQSVRRVLAQLTHDCDCPARYHKAIEFKGHRVSTPAKSSRR